MLGMRIRSADDMNILVDIRPLVHTNPSGVGEYTKRILEALFRANQSHHFTLLSTGSKQSRRNAESAVKQIAHGYTCVQHIHINVPNKFLNLGSLSRFAPTLDTLAGIKPDLLFLPNLNIMRIPDGVPTVLVIHDLTWNIFPHFFSKKMLTYHRAANPKKLIARADWIITPSQSSKQDIQQMYGKRHDRIATIPHGIGKEFSPHLSPHDRGIQLRYQLPKHFALFMGTLEPRKNILSIIDAVEHYRKESGHDLHLILAGGWGWHAKALKTRLHELRHESWVRHLGYVPSEDRPALYRSADVFVWPSFYEGFGLPLLESMACGTPVITSHTSSMPEITSDAAIHIDPYNHLDIADALHQLFSSSRLQCQLQTRSILHASKFSWESTAKRTMKIFEQAGA